MSLVGASIYDDHDIRAVTLDSIRRSRHRVAGDHPLFRTTGITLLLVARMPPTTK